MIFESQFIYVKKTLNLFIMKKFKATILVLTFISINLLLTGCSKDNPYANINLTQGADNITGGDFVGNGGSDSQTYTWTNNRTTAEYNADITASSSGVFQVIVKDSEGTIVLDKSLSSTSIDDSISGVTSVGVSGVWTVTINVSDFNGDGSFSISQGT